METLRLLIGKLLSDLAAPFMSWHSFWFAITGGVRAITRLSSKTGWPYLLSSLVIAWVIYRRTQAIHGKQSFFAFMFPRDVYQHRSAVADYKFVAFELSSRLLFTAPFISTLSYALYRVLHHVLPSIPARLTIHSIMVRSILATFASVAVADLVFFLTHYLLHRIPVLWKFHEVHHSAEVLTPVTVYRVHPVEDLLNGIVGAVVGAFVGIFYNATFDRTAGVVTIFGVNVIVLFFFLFGNVLRHSHVWISYGPVLSRILISPAQHQIHHSSDPRHWDKNFGYIFAFWDWLARTLYIPVEREHLTFGVPECNAEDFSTVPRMYFLPFLKAGQLLFNKRSSNQKLTDFERLAEPVYSAAPRSPQSRQAGIGK